METEKIIKANIDNVKLSYLDENMKFVDLISSKDLKGRNQKERIDILVETISGTIAMLIDALKNDLEDIWNRLDKIEEQKVGGIND